MEHKDYFSMELFLSEENELEDFDRETMAIYEAVKRSIETTNESMHPGTGEEMDNFSLEILNTLLNGIAPGESPTLEAFKYHIAQLFASYVFNNRRVTMLLETLEQVIADTLGEEKAALILNSTAVIENNKLAKKLGLEELMKPAFKIIVNATNKPTDEGEN